MPRTIRRAREIERTRYDILASAAQAFAQNGYHGTTMEDIAGEAGYAIASLYSYFKGKEEIYKSLLKSITEQFVLTFTEPFVSSLNFTQRFEVLLRRQFKVIENNKAFFIMFLGQNHHNPCQKGNEVDPACDENHKLWIAHLKGFLDQGVNTGEVNFPNTETAAFLISGALNSTVMQWIMQRDDRPLLDSLPTTMQFIFNGISLNGTYSINN